MRYGLVLAMLLASACATSFQGDAHFQGGRTSCEQKCSLQGLKMGALVYMGEYSSACICEAADSGSQAMNGSVGATTAAAAGVMMQMQANATASMVSSMIILGTVTGFGIGLGG